LTLKPTRMLLVAGALAALALALYRSAAPNASNVAQNGPCAPDAATIARIAPLAKGEVAAVMVPQGSKPLPELSFDGPEGKKLKLADFSGRTIVLNLWATWCVPCRTEMPSLDKLQATLGSEKFEVVAVNIDQRNLDKPKAFLNEIGVKNLRYYADPSAETFQSLKTLGKAFGMPTTLIISPRGCELAAIAGPADWASPDALALLQAALENNLSVPSAPPATGSAY